MLAFAFDIAMPILIHFVSMFILLHKLQPGIFVFIYYCKTREDRDHPVYEILVKIVTRLDNDAKTKITSFCSEFFVKLFSGSSYECTKIQHVLLNIFVYKVNFGYDTIKY